MKRVTMPDLEALAFETGAEIEIDNERGIAVLFHKRDTYYAALVSEPCS